MMKRCQRKGTCVRFNKVYLNHSIARFIKFIDFFNIVGKVLKLIPCWSEDRTAIY